MLSTRADVPQRCIGHGRRGARRYDLRLKTRYAISRHGLAPITGFGETVNLSVSGLLFRGETRVYPGSSVVTAVEWPVPAPNGEPLYLVLTGHVVRSRGTQTGVSIGSKRWVRESELDERFHVFFGTGSVQGNEIALVDDDAAMLTAVRGVLRSPRWTVKRAQGEAARSIVASGLPAVGLVITGDPDLLEFIPPTIPAVLIVGDSQPEHVLDQARFPRLAIVSRTQFGLSLPEALQKLCPEHRAAFATASTKAV